MQRPTQKWLLPLYIVLLTAAGVFLAAGPVLHYWQTRIIGADTGKELIELAILTIILALTRSMELPVPGRRLADAMDISSVAIFAAYLAKGAGGAITVIVFSAFFTFSHFEDGKIQHIFNTAFVKTLFNNVNLVISVALGALVFEAVGGHPGELAGIQLPGVIGPALLYLIVSLLSDSIGIVVLFRIIRGSALLPMLAIGLRTMAPKLMALSPIGYFLAYLFMIRGGSYMTLLFFVPLLFARFAFKLYLESREQFFHTISTLTAAIEAKDEYTEGHSRRVGQYAVQIAAAMGLKDPQIENIRIGAVLHDIGKIGIEDSILRKPTSLNDEEWTKIQQHPEIGLKILEEVRLDRVVKDMIRLHHIHYDRSGYPEGHRDDPIAMEVHIIMLADAYDAMTSDRPYRKAMSDEVALAIVREERSRQFHPDVVDAFLAMKAAEAAEVHK